MWIIASVLTLFPSHSVIFSPGRNFSPQCFSQSCTAWNSGGISVYPKATRLFDSSGVAARQSGHHARNRDKD